MKLPEGGGMREAPSSELRLSCRSMMVCRTTKRMVPLSSTSATRASFAVIQTWVGWLMVGEGEREDTDVHETFAHARAGWRVRARTDLGIRTELDEEGTCHHEQHAANHKAKPPVH